MATTRPIPMDFRDYWLIAKRRKWYIILPLILIGAMAVAIAMMLPPVYRSEARISVSEAEIPDDLVDTTVAGYVQQRIQSTHDLITTRAELLSMAKRIGYPGAEDPLKQGEIVEALREGLVVENVDVLATEPGNSRQTTVTVALAVSCDAPLPEVAKKCADDHSQRFTEANAEKRLSDAEDIYTFLEQQSTELKKNLAEQENRLAEFKKANQTLLPEASKVTLQLLEQTRSELLRLEDQTVVLSDNLRTLSSQLATTDPYERVTDSSGQTILTEDEELVARTQEFLTLSSRYSASHPDVRRAQRRLRSYANQKSVSGAIGIIDNITRLSSKLSDARSRLGDSHPDVSRFSRELSTYEARLRQIARSGGGEQRQPTVTRANNPVYVNLQSQIASVKANITATRKRIGDLREKETEYERRMSMSPSVAAEYNQLSNDYDAAKKKVQELNDKQIQANMAIAIEREEKAQSFKVLEWGSLPKLPAEPNRVGIILLGLTLAGLVGVLAATISEYLDDRVYGVRGMKSTFGEPPLATIPAISLQGDGKSGKSRRILIAVLLLLVIAGGALYWLERQGLLATWLPS